MHPQLAKLNERFGEAAALAQSACEGLTEEQLTLQPEANRCSVVQCLDLFSCFEIILAHELRHLWQIEHVKADLGLNKEVYEQDRVLGN